jgi:hypothetical protein
VWIDKEGCLKRIGKSIIELGCVIEPGSTTKRSLVVRGASSGVFRMRVGGLQGYCKFQHDVKNRAIHCIFETSSDEQLMKPRLH